jgi:hypothetical protein
VSDLILYISEDGQTRLDEELKRDKKKGIDHE